MKTRKAGVVLSLYIPVQWDIHPIYPQRSSHGPSDDEHRLSVGWNFPISLLRQLLWGITYFSGWQSTRFLFSFFFHTLRERYGKVRLLNSHDIHIMHCWEAHKPKYSAHYIYKCLDENSLTINCVGLPFPTHLIQVWANAGVEHGKRFPMQLDIHYWTWQDEQVWEVRASVLLHSVQRRRRINWWNKEAVWSFGNGLTSTFQTLPTRISVGDFVFFFFFKLFCAIVPRSRTSHPHAASSVLDAASHFVRHLTLSKVPSTTDTCFVDVSYMLGYSTLSSVGCTRTHREDQQKAIVQNVQASFGMHRCVCWGCQTMMDLLLTRVRYVEHPRTMDGKMKKNSKI